MALDTGQFGSLDGTLTGQNVLSQMQALAEAHQAALAQSAAAAAQSAGSAQQDYTQAANAPAPQLNPADVFLPTLLSNIASVIAQDPSYKQHNQQNMAQERQGLLQRRTENLQALHEVYQQKAEQATKLGDLEATEKYRTKMEALTKTLDVLSKQNDQAATRQRELDVQGLRNKGDIEQERIRQAGETQRARDKSAADTALATDSLDNEVKLLTSGRQYLPLTNVKGQKATTAALQYAKDHNLPAVSAMDDDRLGKLDIARQNAGDMIESLRNFLPATWKDVGKAVKNKAADIAGSDPEIRNYHQFYEALIEQLVALAGGRGSGVRVNKDEINRLVHIAPTVTTPLPVAEGWVKRVYKLIDNAEGTALNRARLAKPTSAGEQGSGSAPGARSAALEAAEAGDRTEFLRLIGSNRGLDSDSTLYAAARKRGWLKAAK